MRKTPDRVSSRELSQKTSVDFLKFFSRDLKKIARGVSERDNQMIHRDFGQSWNLGNISSAQLLFLSHRLLFKSETKKSRKAGADQEKLYELLVILNPELKNIRTDTAEKRGHLIDGVATGLHFNDIRHFIEDLDCSGLNQSPYDKALYLKAVDAYYERTGALELLSRTPFHLSPTDKALVRETESRVGYVLCNETARRIIENRPYPTKEKK